MWIWLRKRLHKKLIEILPILLGSFALALGFGLLYWLFYPLFPNEWQTWLEHLQSQSPQETLQALHQSFEHLGFLKYPVYLLIQIGQVFFAPIPGQVIGLLGGYLFGFWVGLGLSIVGLGLGSALAMLTSRWIGRRLVERLLPDNIRQNLDYLVEQGGLMNFFIIFLLPALPDDAACFMAGLTRLRLLPLLGTSLLGRLPGIAVLTFVGAHLEADTAFLRILLALLGAMAFFLWLFQDEIEFKVHALLKKNNPV